MLSSYYLYENMSKERLLSLWCNIGKQQKYDISPLLYEDCYLFIPHKPGICYVHTLVYLQVQPMI